MFCRRVFRRRVFGAGVLVFGFLLASGQNKRD
jgi:hypothetical protein